MSVAVRPFLMFEGRAEEAMSFYVSLIPGSRALHVQRYGPEGPGPEGSVTKLAFTEAYVRMAETASALLGLHGQLWRETPRAPDGGRWAFQTVFARRFAIAGGTSEIQRGIIGDRVLGLPRS